MDIRDAIFALVNVIQKSSKKVDTHDAKTTEMTEKVWISRKKSQKIKGQLFRKILLVSPNQPKNNKNKNFVNISVLAS